MSARGWSKDEMGRRVAAELEDGWIVNVGTGMPTLVLPHVPPDRDLLFHSENGIIGMGPEVTDPARQDGDLMSAGRRYVSLVPGAAIVHHADSFALARSGRIDVTILGGYQVSAAGDLANWKLPGARTGNIGGAMDLVAGVKRVFVIMRHATAEGRPKIVEQLSYPVTGRRCVTKIFTDLAVIRVARRVPVVEALAPDTSLAEVQALTEPRLTAA